MSGRLVVNWRRTALAGLGLVAGHAALGTLAVPWAMKNRIPVLAAEKLHRRATLADARFNPYTLTATLVGLDLRDRDGTPLFAAETLVVDLAAASAVQRALVLDELRLHHPTATLRLGPDGRPTIADLFEDSTASADTTMARFAVRRAVLHAGEVDLVDESRAPTYREEFRDLALELDDISTLPDENGSHALTARFASGATIAWQGDASLAPLRLDGRFDLAGLRLPKLSEAFGAHLPLRLVRGTLDGAVPYHVERAPDGSIVATLPTVRATLHDVAARPAGAAGEWLRATRVDVEETRVAWPAREASVRAVRVHEPWLQAVRLADGTLDWQALRMPPPGDAPSDGPPWRVRVDSVTLTGGTLHLEDRTVSPALALDVTPVTLRLAGVSTDSTAPVGLNLEAATGARTRLAVHGTATPAPFSAELDVALERLDVTLAQRYLGADAPIRVASGTASLTGKARLRTGKPATTFDGGATASGVTILDAQGDSLLAWRGMRVEGLHYTAQPDLARVGKVTLERPFARVAISRERELNLSRIMTELRGDTLASEPVLPYEVGAVVIRDGVVDFSDESLILPFRTTVDSTQGTIEDLASFGGTPGSMKIEGVVDRDGFARAVGSLHPADPFAATDIEVEFRNLDLQRFTPYSAQFAGYAIKAGRLDMDLHYRIKERLLDADHHIVAKDLALGEKVEGGESPGFLVKLAVSLMKDRDGRITLDVPVGGTVDDPEFSYRGIVWKAMKQMLGKVATAPFRFLGKLLGIGGDSPELVEFEPGRSDLIPPEREKLDSLAAMLARKPELQIGMTGRYDATSDAEAIREGRVQAMIAAHRDSLFKGKQSGDTSASTLGRTLESLYAALYTPAALDSLRDSVKAVVAAAAGKGPRPRKGYETPGYFDAMRARMLASQVVDSTALLELARARVTTVGAALLAAGLADSTRLLPPEVEPVKAKKEGSPRVPSELRMDTK